VTLTTTAGFQDLISAERTSGPVSWACTDNGSRLSRPAIRAWRQPVFSAPACRTPPASRSTVTEAAGSAAQSAKC